MTNKDKFSQLLSPPLSFKYSQSSEMQTRWLTLLFKSCRVMGSVAAAREWLDAPKYVLNNEKPIDLAQSEEGFEEVCQLLGRIEHGVFS
ncbi:MAG: MbcA/ParS/Xre antitoxin family protein [Cycloclasticus sp.]|nr:MbcA/ParS/Xre antitoxin family protein [Cycloclasticus sp.]